MVSCTVRLYFIKKNSYQNESLETLHWEFWKDTKKTQEGNEGERRRTWGCGEAPLRCTIIGKKRQRENTKQKCTCSVSLPSQNTTLLYTHFSPHNPWLDSPGHSRKWTSIILQWRHIITIYEIRFHPNPQVQKPLCVILSIEAMGNCISPFCFTKNPQLAFISWV